MIYRLDEESKLPIGKKTWCVENRPGGHRPRTLIRHHECGRIIDVTRLAFLAKYWSDPPVATNHECWDCPKCHGSLIDLTLIGWSIRNKYRGPLDPYMDAFESVLKTDGANIDYADVKRSGPLWGLRLYKGAHVNIVKRPKVKSLRVYVKVIHKERVPEMTYKDFRSPRKAIEAAIDVLTGTSYFEKVDTNSPGFVW